MPQITVKVKTELVRQGLEDLNAEIPQVGRRRIRTVMDRIKRRMEEYPPEPAHRMKTAHHSILGTIITKTGRTGLMGRSWRINQLSTGYTLENTAQRKGRAYSGYVVGDAYGTGQAWMHQGRWNLFRDVVDEEVEKLPDEIGDEIMMVARRDGLA